jgi:hypothetical protein
VSHCGVLLRREENPRKSAPPTAGAVFDNERRRRGARGGDGRSEGERSSCEDGWMSGDVRHSYFMPAP